MAAVVTELFSQLNNHLIQRACGAVIVITPDLVEQTVARKNFAGMVMEYLEKLEFLCCELLDALAAPELKRFWVDLSSANPKSCIR